ncbi:hypothetical protein SZO_06120 [Streptococcus equi subsp. zooepidemicus]|uniref:Uncharacterized protein n=1 Tax=Streptococcus equi subsp. zooepidemicus (strain H70) TaxID=553483 RepID=C0MCZ7_STRS7|nr:hypothetical protein SZO_06120 [Streptococcus equi subsp. zooepidemicus]
MLFVLFRLVPALSEPEAAVAGFFFSMIKHFESFFEK